jgi:hypothetical protein
VQFDGVRSLEKYYQDLTTIDAEGTVTHAQRLYMDVAVPLDLKDFPFDKRVLAVDFDPVFSSIEEVVFVEMESLVGRSDSLCSCESAASDLVSHAR